VNGLTKIALTKLDILSHFDTIKVAVAYDSLDQRYDEFPRQQRVLYNCRPVYEELPGWKTDISEMTEYGQLPEEARRYVEYVEELAGVPIATVSVGPSRAATLQRET
jgi:adenylosuccinate synthase